MVTPCVVVLHLSVFLSLLALVPGGQATLLQTAADTGSVWTQGSSQVGRDASLPDEPDLRPQPSPQQILLPKLAPCSSLHGPDCDLFSQAWRHQVGLDKPSRLKFEKTQTEVPFEEDKRRLVRQLDEILAQVLLDDPDDLLASLESSFDSEGIQAEVSAFDEEMDSLGIGTEGSGRPTIISLEEYGDMLNQRLTKKFGSDTTLTFLSEEEEADSLRSAGVTEYSVGSTNAGEMGMELQNGQDRPPSQEKPSKIPSSVDRRASDVDSPNGSSGEDGGQDQRRKIQTEGKGGGAPSKRDVPHQPAHDPVPAT